MKRAVAFALSAILLLATGVIGVYDGVTEWSDAHTFGQRTVTGGVLLYGLLAFVAFAGLVLRKPWSFTITVVWGVVVTYVATAAVLAYGGPDASVGAAAAACIGTALVVAAVAWGARIATRQRASPLPAPPSP